MTPEQWSEWFAVAVAPEIDVAADGPTPEEQRTALAQLVDKVEFDPATGEGRVHYRVPLTPLGDGRFDTNTAAADLGLPGYVLATPRGFEPRLPP